MDRRPLAKRLIIVLRTPSILHAVPCCYCYTSIGRGGKVSPCGASTTSVQTRMCWFSATISRQIRQWTDCLGRAIEAKQSNAMSNRLPADPFTIYVPFVSNIRAKNFNSLQLKIFFCCFSRLLSKLFVFDFMTINLFTVFRIAPGG